MFMELQSVLRLEETSLEGKFVHICEEEDQIGTFLLHHFLHLGIKILKDYSILNETNPKINHIKNNVMHHRSHKRIPVLPP